MRKKRNNNPSSGKLKVFSPYVVRLLDNRTCEIAGVEKPCEASLSILSDLGGYKVIGIGERAFLDRTDLTHVSLPEGIEYIGTGAFADCVNLSAVNIPESVRRIGGQAFFACTSLGMVTIPASVQEIGEGAFACCGLDDIVVAPENEGYYSETGCLIEVKNQTLIAGSNYATIPENSELKMIAVGAFGDCKRLESITIPGSVIIVGSFAFIGCESLEKVQMKSGVGGVCCEAFKDCKRLSSVELPDTLEGIGREAFSGCESLSGLDLPDSLTLVDNKAFKDCRALREIHFPADVSEIGKGVLRGCVNLSTITVDPGNEDYCAYGNCLIETEYNFVIAGCHSSVIPNEKWVVGIGDAAFAGQTLLKKLEIPANIHCIGEAAFAECNNLMEVTFVDRNGWVANKERLDLSSPFEAARLLADDYSDTIWAQHT